MSGDPTPGRPPARTNAIATRLRAESRGILRRRICVPASDVALELAAVWETEPPSAAAVGAVLGDDPTAHLLPDGRFVHVMAAVEDRMWTTRADGVGGAPIVLPVQPDLTVALLPYPSWQRIPVRRGRRHGMAERARTPAGAEVLVLDPALVPVPDPLVAVVPGPEGLRLVGVAADDLTTAALTRVLVRPAGVGGAARVGSWSPVDRLLLALASDPSLCRAPADPIGRILDLAGHRDHGQAA